MDDFVGVAAFFRLVKKSPRLGTGISAPRFVFWVLLMNGLDSARLKFKRAEKQIRAMNRTITAYSQSKPYQVVRHPDRTEQPRLRRQPPKSLPVVSGEVLYQIRSALDHLMFETIKRNLRRVTLPPRWEDGCEFPIKFRLPDKVAVPPVRHPKFETWTKLPGLPDKTYALIEPLQPYNTIASDPVGGALGLLSLLSNIDKHRYLHLATAKAQRTDRFMDADGTELVASGPVDWDAHLQPIDAISQGGVDVEREFAIYVTFNEARISNRNKIPMESVLEQLLEFFRGLASSLEEVLK